MSVVKVSSAAHNNYYLDRHALIFVFVVIVQTCSLSLLKLVCALTLEE